MMQELQVVNSDEQEDSATLIPEAYKSLTEVFSETQVKILPPHCKGDHLIDLLEGTTPPFNSIYNLSTKKLTVLQKYLNINLTNEFIQPLQSSAEVSVLFASKGDRGLQLCVDYHRLNAIMQKNQYPLSLIDEIMNCVCGAQIFTKIDIQNTYYYIYIHKGDEWKTAFCTQYRLYKYLIMPFSLTNAPASFQSYIHKVLHKYLDIFVIVFLNNILIYSIKESQYEQHIQIVLKALLVAELFMKLLKCLFSMKCVPFLRYVITDTGVEIEAE